jgi:hypothetical protein
MKNQKNSNPKSKMTKWILWGLGVITTGIVSVFSYQYWKKNQASKPDKSKSVPDEKVAQTTTTNPKTNIKQSVKDFLKTNIHANKKTGAAKGGANTSTSKTKTGHNISAAKKLSDALHSAVNEKDFNKVTSLLETIKTPAAYSSVNKIFSLKGIRQSLVTKLLNTFNSDEEKQSLSDSFKAMGLKYNGKKWSLSGLDDKPFLITTRPTQVWKDPHTAVSVPEKMVLGKEVDQRGSFTLFENERQYFLVQSQHVRHYATNTNS